MTFARLAFAGVLADSAADFSPTQGTKGWFYGYFTGGNIHAFAQLPTYNAASQQWQHTTFGPPWTLVGANSVVHPNGTNDGAEEWAVREWVSSYAGRVTIAGRLAKAAFAAVPASTGVYGRIYRNHQLLYEQFVAGTDSTGVSYTLDVTLSAGDILDFVLAPNGADTSDTTVFSAKVSSEYDAASVDFGAPTPVKPALGILNGFQQPLGSNPPDNLILPLQPRFWHGELYEYQRIRSVAPSIPVELLFQPGIPANNYAGMGPPWQNWTAYQNWLQGALAPFAPAPSNVFFQPWDEPDDGWAFQPGQPGYQEFFAGTAEQFYETYLHAFQTIRSTLGPDAQIAGPEFAVYDHQGIQAFLEYCLANGCEVNSLAWHELNDATSVSTLPLDVQDARASFFQNPRYAPLKMKHVDVTEIVGSLYTHQPAGTLAYDQALEASGADYSARSCWTLASGVQECFNGTLGGLLTPDTFQPRAVWWLFKSYADGVSGRVRALASNPNVVVLASSSITGAPTPQILVGNSNFQDTVTNTPDPVSVTLSLANLQAVPGIGQATNLAVRVELIPNTGETAVSQPALVEEINAGVTGGAAIIALPPLQIGEVFRVTLLPSTPAVATIASGGVVDPWNYTPGAAPGSWISIVGSNLGPAVPQSWNPQPGAALPTTLGGVSVSIGGTLAALSYVSSSQINALVPANTPAGMNSVIVTNGGAAGNPFVLQVDSTHPGIYGLPDPANPQNLYATAALAGTSNLIGKPGVDPRVTRGAHPGETVDLYLVGLGATLDSAAFLTNQLFSEAAPVAAPVEIEIGGQLVLPSFAGLISPGLYLVRLTVPSALSPGDALLSVGAGGAFSGDHIYFTISPAS